jgi:hypothetical protein
MIEIPSGKRHAMSKRRLNALMCEAKLSILFEKADLRFQEANNLLQ